VCNKNANLEVWSESDLDLEDQQVIKADVVRTRQNIALFKTEQVQKDLETLLTVYCKRRSVKYTQGLNEIIAPFFVLDLEKGEIFNCFYALIQKFIPNTLRGHDLKTLRRSLDMLRLLLLYHCPVLCRRLDSLELRPDLFATSWLATMMAGDLEMDVLLRLWDELLLRDDPLFVHFAALAAVAREVEGLERALRESPEQGAERLRRLLRGADAARLTELARLASALDQQTPRSFRRKLYRATVQNEALDSEFDFLIQESPCLTIAASDLAPPSAASGALTSAARQLRFLVLDCRPEVS